MNKYELMYIIDVSLDDEPRKELIERVSKLITDNGGEVEKVDEWGKRRLAYTINYKNEGYYVLSNFTAPAELPREIERILQINENVLRYLVIRLEEKHTSVKPRTTPLRPVYGRPFAPDSDTQIVEEPTPVEAVTPAQAAPAAPVQAAAPAQAEAPVAEAQAEAPVVDEATANLDKTVEVESGAPAPATEEAIENLNETVATEAE